MHTKLKVFYILFCISISGCATERGQRVRLASRIGSQCEFLGNVSASLLSRGFFQTSSIKNSGADLGANWIVVTAIKNGEPDEGEAYKCPENNSEQIVPLRVAQRDDSDDQAEFGAAFAGAVHKSFTPSNDESNSKECFGDSNCGTSQRCAKKPNAYRGICIDVYYVNPWGLYEKYFIFRHTSNAQFYINGWR